MKKFCKRAYLALILIFLYLPIIVLIVQSFNAGKSRAKWEGFSFRWYTELFQDTRIMNALTVTVTIALLAMVVATILGTLAAIGIHAMKKRPQSFMMTLTNLPNTMPDIVTGISLMLLFLFTKVDRGYVTMLLAHITFDTPYVILSVLPKLKQMNRHTYEAALDLGATPMYALFHVIIPECMPGIITGLLEGGGSGDPAGHHHRGHAGVHSLAGRLHYQLLHDLPAGAESVHADLLRRPPRHRADAQRTVGAHVRRSAGAAADCQPPHRIE